MRSRLLVIVFIIFINYIYTLILLKQFYYRYKTTILLLCITKSLRRKHYYTIPITVYTIMVVVIDTRLLTENIGDN